MAKTPRKFDSIVGSMMQPPAATGTTEAVERAKQVNFLLDPDLRKSLDRLVFWGGPSNTQRAVFEQALRELAQRDPNSQRPVPGE